MARLMSCSPYVAGLHLFEDIDLDATRMSDLQNSVEMLQDQGALVKLAYGGEEWGNTMLYSAAVQNLI